MAENDQEKTEQATSRKREEAREEGGVASSRELGSFFVIFGSILILYFTSVWVFMGMSDLMRGSFLSIGRGEITPGDLYSIFQRVSWKILLIIAPALTIPVFGAASYVLQNGVVFAGKRLTPDLGKLNPIAGAKRLLSLSSIIELIKSILKISVLGYVVYINVAREWVRLPLLVEMDVISSVYYIGSVTFTIMVKTAWVVAVIAAADFLYQRWHFEKSLRMTKEEIKEETRETEGDPMVKSRIRSVQREIARRRMMQEVPKADVVVTNPTHLAVALKYDRLKASAPTVVAKGAGIIAEKIKEIAREHKVPVIENKPLARTLFKSVKIGKEIPADMYKAVAEILAYVYKLKSRVKR